jgi:hypothetical protein
MMSADLVTGELGWNTTIIDDATLREVRGKPPKGDKVTLADQYGLIRPAGKNVVSDLDALVTRMETSQNIPGGAGARRASHASDGTALEGSSPGVSPAYRAKPKPSKGILDTDFARIMAKYENISPETLGRAYEPPLAKPAKKPIGRPRKVPGSAPAKPRKRS